MPGYELIESLGQGGMGEVFRAEQVSLGREVAVKILRSDLGPKDWLPERFEREARTMATLHHPHLVTVHDCLRTPHGQVAIVMELIRGGNLRQRIAAAPCGLPVTDVLRWTRHIADGLRVAHEAGVLHRDIKPENVLIDDKGSARVSDFGLAVSMQSPTTRYTQAGHSIGTVGYMAPEQLRGENADARSDVFSLGVVIYEMLVGRVPQGSFRAARKIRPEVPAPLDRLVLSILRPEPEQRPASMAAVLEQLRRISDPQLHHAIPRRAFLIAGIAALAGGGIWRLSTPNYSTAKRQSLENPWHHANWPESPQQTAIKGGWTREGVALVSNEEICILPTVNRLPKAWMIRLRFRRMTGGHSVAIFFRTPEGTGTFTLASWASDLGGVQNIGGRTLQETGAFHFDIENERLYEWTVEYRRGFTKTWIDGDLKQERDISAQLLNVAQPWEWNPGPDSADLLLGSWHSSVRFESLEWRPLD